jgi:hypothetical protein
VAVARQFSALGEASNTTDGAQLNNIFNWEKYDATRMTANISHNLVHYYLRQNGSPTDASNTTTADYYLYRGAFDLKVLLRDYPLN